MVTAFVIIFATGLLAMTGLVLDGGRTLVTYREAKNAADSAARAGAQAIDEAARRQGRLELDPTAAENLACGLLQKSGYPCGANARVVAAGDTVEVFITTSVDMWLLQGVTTTLQVEGDACVAVGISGPTTACG